VYPQEERERCVGQSQPWVSKARRVRQRTMLVLVWFVIGLALGSRLNQRLVWDKLVGKLSVLHPGEPTSRLSASALSGRRQELGGQGLQTLRHECSQGLGSRSRWHKGSCPHAACASTAGRSNSSTTTTSPRSATCPA